MLNGLEKLLIALFRSVRRVYGVGLLVSHVTQISLPKNKISYREIKRAGKTKFSKCANELVLEWVLRSYPDARVDFVLISFPPIFRERARAGPNDRVH